MFDKNKENKKGALFLFLNTGSLPVTKAKEYAKTVEDELKEKSLYEMFDIVIITQDAPSSVNVIWYNT